MTSVPSPPPVISPIPRATPVSSAGAAVVVCGSANYDTFFLLDHHPSPGETVIAGDSFSALGGKGANQAVACSRAGVSTYLLATVGEDSAGDFILKELAHQGVHISEVNQDSTPTGRATVLYDSSGENSIIITSGANVLTNPLDYLSRMDAIMEQHEVPVLLAQGELSAEHTKSLPILAQYLGARLVLNMAPVSCRDSSLLSQADPLILNENEAQELLGLSFSYSPSTVDSPSASSSLALSVSKNSSTNLSSRGEISPPTPNPASIVITLGSRGAVIFQGNVEGIPTSMTAVDDLSSISGRGVEAEYIAPYPVKTVVDTTGAGDAFCGTLAAALAQGMDLSEAARYGCAAGALATQKTGAAQSYATWEQIALLISHPTALSH